MEIELNEFINRFPKINQFGKITTIQEFENLSPKIKSLLPEWLLNLMQKYPLAGAEIGIPYNFGQEEFIGKPSSELPILNITINDLKTIEEYTLNLFPGYILASHNYICIAIDNDATQEGIFINIKETNPKLFLVFHDFGNTPKGLITNAEILLDRFSDLFKVGVIGNNY
jgi:hypothetical protein